LKSSLQKRDLKLTKIELTDIILKSEKPDAIEPLESAALVRDVDELLQPLPETGISSRKRMMGFPI